MPKFKDIDSDDLEELEQTIIRELAREHAFKNSPMAKAELKAKIPAPKQDIEEALNNLISPPNPPVKVFKGGRGGHVYLTAHTRDIDSLLDRSKTSQSGRF